LRFLIPKFAFLSNIPSKKETYIVLRIIIAQSMELKYNAEGE